MFNHFSDNERGLIVDRLHQIGFQAVVMENGADFFEGSLVASHENSGLLIVIDLSSGFDRLSGIPDRYLGFIIDEELFHLAPSNQNPSTLMNTVSNVSASTKIVAENLDVFFKRIYTTITEGNKTERQVIIKQRVGQKAFRDNLIKHWGGKCIITGISNLALLRA